MMSCDEDLYCLKTIFFAECVKEKLWTELIKSVSDPIISLISRQKMPADGGHLHTVIDHGPKVKDVLNSSTLDHTRVTIPMFSADRQIHVV